MEPITYNLVNGFQQILKPDGTTDGLVMFRIKDVENVVLGFVLNWEEYDE